MSFMKRDGMTVIGSALEGMRREIGNLKTGIDLCERQQEANKKTIEMLSDVNLGLSAKAAGARSLVSQFDSLIPVTVD